MSIRDLARHPLEAVRATVSVAEVAKRMRDQNVGALVVTEGTELVGIVTDRDLVVRVMAEGRDASNVCVDEIMSRNLVYLPNDCSVESAVRTMRDMGVRRVPTVDENGKPDGMLALDDVLLSLSRQLGGLSDTAGVAVGPHACNAMSVADVQRLREG